MSLAAQALALWRRALPFRVVVIVAAASTAATILLPTGTRSTTQAPPSNTTSTSQTPAQSQAQALTQCGPQGGTALQAPLVVGQSVPANVTAVGGAQAGGVPLDVQARFNQFAVQVNAAAGEARMGESCTLMASAIGQLQPLDYAYADCFAGGNDLLTKAQNCAQRHDQSEQRLARLSATHTDIGTTASAPNIAALARARADLTPYDESREAWKRFAQAIAAGDGAIAAIAASDARIDRLVGAANAAEAQPGVAQLAALAAAADLDSFDLTRLSEEQARMLEQARTARDSASDSDRRLDRLADALTSLRSGSADARAELIAAVTGLTSFDTQRASADQTALIATARSEAAGFALHDLLTEAAGFDPQSATPAQFQRLVDLAQVVRDYGGVTEPNEVQSRALAAAQGAAETLTRSDRRIEAMSMTMNAVDAGGPAALGDQVGKSFEDITAFDQARMTDAQRQQYDRLGAARTLWDQTRSGRLGLSVPLFLKAEGTDATDALAALRNALVGGGFQLVETEEQSAVRLTLTVGEAQKNALTAGSTRVETVRLPMRLTGDWTFKGDRLPVIESEGVGRGRDALDKATDAAIAVLVSDLTALTEPD